MYSQSEISSIAGVKSIARLHYLTQDLPNISHVKQAEDACKGGIEWLQLRAKNLEIKDWIRTTQQVKSITDHYGVKLIINDNPYVAAEVKATGVHLGKEDMHPKEARLLLGDYAIIGGTANTAEDIERLVDTGVDYIGLGPFRFTQTKKNLSPQLSIAQICELIDIQDKIPVILIGGIQADDIELIASTGAYGAAVSSAINLAENSTTATGKFIELIKEQKWKNL